MLLLLKLFGKSSKACVLEALLSSIEGPIMAIFSLHWYIAFNVCGRFGLSGLQHEPVENRVTAYAFVGIDFNNEAGFV